MTPPRIAALILAVSLLAAAEPWFAAECDHTLEARCAGRSQAAESAGRLPFLDLPAGAAVAVRRVAYDQKGAALWRIPGGLPAAGTLALAFRPDAGASGERPLLRLAGIDLVLDGVGRPQVRAAGAAAALVGGAEALEAGIWHRLALQWDGGRGTLALVADGRRADGALPAGSLGGGPGELWLGATSLDNFTGAAAEGAFDWVRVVAGADPAALTAATTAAQTAATIAANAEGGPLAPQPPSAKEARRWDTAGAARISTAVSDRLCLNGTWRFLPAAGPRQRPDPAQAWLHTRMPGRWQETRLFPTWDAAGKPVTAVAGQPLGKSFHGWLVRQVQVPADFRGSRLVVACDLINADQARFYRDGRLVGEFINGSTAERISTRRQEADLGPVVPGEHFELAVELGFQPFQNQWTSTEASLVDLALEGRGALRTTAAVLRSTDDGNAEVLAQVANPDGAARTGTWAVRVLGEDGALLREVPGGSLAFAAGERGRELRLAVPWQGLPRWSPEAPQLQRFQVVLRDAAGAASDETVPRTCGVRRFTQERDGFHLDGVRRRLLYDSSSHILLERYAMLHSDPAVARAAVRELKQAGYNTIGVNPGWNAGSLGRPPYAVEVVLDAADREGLLVILSSPELARGDDPAAHRQLVRDYVRAWGSHPSVAMHLATFNDCWYHIGQHPQAPLMADYRPAGKDATRARALGWEQTLRAEDPGRPVYHNASGNLTALFTTMHYLSFGMPLQEREDWPSAWSTTKPNLLFPSEIGLPYFEQFKDFNFPERNHGPLLTVEHAARYLGDRAYALTRSPSMQDTVMNRIHDDDGARPEVMAIKELFARRCLTAWRAWDLPGIGLFGEATFAYRHDHSNRALPQTYGDDRTWGIKPAVVHVEHRRALYDQPTPYRDALRAALAPVTASLGGPDSPSAKTHAWFAGEAIAKEAVLVNDGATALELAVTAELRGPAGVAARWEGRRTVAPGEVARLPFTLAAPAVTERTAMTLVLAASAGERRWGDELPVAVWPAHRPPGDLGAAVAVVDPGGATSALLAKAGIAATPATTLDAVRAAKVLVVGRAALGDQPVPLLAEVERAGLIEAGLTVLVFEQAPGLCGNLVHAQTRHRTAFVRAAGHPALAGLADADLHDWRGASTLVPATTPVTASFENTPHYPHEKYAINADGMVAGWSVRRPDRGGWTVLADAGFDLRDACLLEQRRGRGRVLLCQLEVTGRYGADPAATRLADNLLRWAATPAPATPAERSGAILGSGPYAAALAEAFPALATAGDPAASDLLVLAPAASAEGPAWAASATAVLARGGTVVWLHPGGAADLSWLGAPLAAEAVTAWRAQPAAALPAGLGAADLHWRYPRALARFTGATPWCDPGVLAEARVGAGRVLLVGLPLDAFAPKPYQLGKQAYTSFIDVEMKRKALALVGRVLGEAGAAPLPIPLFAAGLGEDNTVGGLRAHIDLPTWRFGTDPDDQGVKGGWAKPGFDDSAWRDMIAGRSWEAQGVTGPGPASHRYHAPLFAPGGSHYAPYDGCAWYRTRVTIPAGWKDGDVRLVMGTVDDTDTTFLDGEQIGATGSETPKHWEARREYLIPPSRIRYDQPQVIAIRVFDQHGGGGLTTLPVRLELTPRTAAGATPYVSWKTAYDVDAFHNW
ncbi:MAG: hypothetical protein L6R48_06605 [Planctomycetes bacterium]|nr:hypothetical protein [Planctomycetota bacterium]